MSRGCTPWRCTLCRSVINCRLYMLSPTHCMCGTLSVPTPTLHVACPVALFVEWLHTAVAANSKITVSTSCNVSCVCVRAPCQMVPTVLLIPFNADLRISLAVRRFLRVFFCIVQLDLSGRNGITLEVCVAVVSTRTGCARSHPHTQTPTHAYMRTCIHA